MKASTIKAKNLKIDPTAIVHPGAALGAGVEVGPYSVISEDVSIGENTRIGPHAFIDRWTTIGRDCAIYQFTSIGAPPQDMGYKGEKTEVIIGDRNIIREFVTIHRSTTKQEKKTVIGNDNMLMNYVHIAHDCTLGDNIIMANAATLGGHVSIDDSAIVGGLVAVHQHVRIGAYCIIGGASAVTKDIPPYVMAVGNRAHLFGLNAVGLRRKGFSKADIAEIKTAYSIIFRSSLSLSDAVGRLEEQLPGSAHAGRFLDFIKGTKRGIARERQRKKDEDLDEKD